MNAVFCTLASASGISSAGHSVMLNTQHGALARLVGACSRWLELALIQR